MRLRWAALSLRRNWKRLALVTLVVALSAGTVVMLTMLTQSSAANTAAGFENEDSLVVTATLPAGESWQLPDEQLLRRVPDSTTAGTFTEVKQELPMRWLGVNTSVAPVVVATHRGLDAHGWRLVEGRGLPSEAVLAHDPNHVLVGTRFAKDFAITPGSIVRVAGVDLFVDGLISDTGRRSLLATTIVVSPKTAGLIGLDGAARSVLVRSDAAHIPGIAERMALMLAPAAPETVNVVGGKSTLRLQQRLMRDANNLVMAVALILGAVSMMTVLVSMLGSLRQRRREIGIMLALGASRANIAVLIAVEAAVLGAIGGVIGWAVAVVFGSGIAASLGWPVVHPIWLWGVPIAATFVSLVGAVVPGKIASDVDPIELIRAN